MAASRGQEFFHGTIHNIGVGEGVLPGQKVGHTNWGDTGKNLGQPSEAHAFATSDEGIAWTFAQRAHRMNSYNPDFVPDRVRVYRVAPNDQMEMGVHNRHHPDYYRNFPEGGEDLKEYVAPHFTVTERVDTMPGHQGTFPQLNWAQFAHPHLDQFADVNHPEPLDIERGHIPHHNSPAYDQWKVRNTPQVDLSDLEPENPRQRRLF